MPAPGYLTDSKLHDLQVIFQLNGFCRRSSSTVGLSKITSFAAAGKPVLKYGGGGSPLPAASLGSLPTFQFVLVRQSVSALIRPICSPPPKMYPCLPRILVKVFDSWSLLFPSPSWALAPRIAVHWPANQIILPPSQPGTSSAYLQILFITSIFVSNHTSPEM